MFSFAQLKENQRIPNFSSLYQITLYQRIAKYAVSVTKCDAYEHICRYSR